MYVRTACWAFLGSGDISSYLDLGLAMMTDHFTFPSNDLSNLSVHDHRMTPQVGDVSDDGRLRICGFETGEQCFGSV